MRDSLAGVALAAGAGRRLLPLTRLRPKPLCPVGDRTLLDWAMHSLAPAVTDRAVNVHHGAAAIEAHLESRPGIHIARELPEALGTAGALAGLRTWLDGRSALIVNADTWQRADLAEFARGWDGERVRVLYTGPGSFGPSSTVVASILPWANAADLVERPSGLWEQVWRAELDAGRLDAVSYEGVAIDCGTAATYLAANLSWSGGIPVIGDGASVAGSVTRCVVWPGSRVNSGERLVDAIRAEHLTVLVRH